MAPKKPASSGTTERLRGVAGLRGRRRRNVRAAPPYVQAGPYQSTPKRDNTKPTVAPRNILEEHKSAAVPSTKPSSRDISSGKEGSPLKSSLRRDSKSQSSPSFSQSPTPKSAKKKKMKTSPEMKSAELKSPAQKQITAGRPTLSGRPTPTSVSRAASSSASGPDSSRQRRSYRHGLRRSLYGATSRPRSSSSRRSSTSDASTSLTTSKATSPSAPHASVKKEKILPAKLEGTRRSVGAIDASFARHSNLNTPHLQGSGSGSTNTPFRAPGPKVARRGQEPKPPQDCSKEQLALWDEQIKTWLNKSWKLCYLSAMSSFDIHNANLRSLYQKALRNKMSELLPFTVQVELAPVHCFTRSQHVTDAVVLTISYSIPREWDLRTSPKGKKKKKEPSERRRVLYKSLLVRALLRDSQADEAGVCWYPLYFYTGRQRIHQAVEQWLSDSFGACSSVKSLRTTALLWAAGLWYQQSCGSLLSKPVGVSLSYALEGLSSHGWQQHRQFPSSHRVRDVSFVTLEMPADQMRRIALCFLPESDNEYVTKDQRDLFHVTLQQLVTNLTSLPKQALRLLSVKTSCVALTRNGQVKVSCKRHFLGLLQWLLELHREDSLLEQVADVDHLSQDLDDIELNDDS